MHDQPREFQVGRWSLSNRPHDPRICICMKIASTSPIPRSILHPAPQIPIVMKVLSKSHEKASIEEMNLTANPSRSTTDIQSNCNRALDQNTMQIYICGIAFGCSSLSDRSWYSRAMYSTWGCKGVPFDAKRWHCVGWGAFHLLPSACWSFLSYGS